MWSSGSCSVAGRLTERSCHSGTGTWEEVEVEGYAIVHQYRDIIRTRSCDHDAYKRRSGRAYVSGYDRNCPGVIVDIVSAKTKTYTTHLCPYGQGWDVIPILSNGKVGRSASRGVVYVQRSGNFVFG